jgi:ABC-type branched-subunit amino acid transport system substrate-binding protein
MSNRWSDPTVLRSSYLNSGSVIMLCGTLLATTVGLAHADNISVVRDLASRVGPIVGAASACSDVARSRTQGIAEKFRALIRQSSSNDPERDDLGRLFERYATDGRGAVSTGRIDCRTADRQLTELEQSIGRPAPPAPPAPSVVSTLAGVLAPSSAAAATAPAQPLPPPPPLAPGEVHGVTDREIRFGIVIPYTGGAKANGHNMKLGVDLAFARANDNGGVNGRMLKLIPADDGFEPSRTLDAMKTLWDKEQVFGFVGNHGTPTAAIAVPYALERHALFFGALTGATVVRHDPPDRYVFNYRPSYMEEVDAAVRYLIKVRKLQPKQIAVFGQNDAFGDSGFAGVAKSYRALGLNDAAIVRLKYNRNTVDVDDAVSQLKSQKGQIRAAVIVATTRAAAKFIEKTHDLFPGMIYSNISAVGASTLAEELTLLGPRFTQGVIVTQTVPAVGGSSSVVLDYKNALAKYFPGEPPDYISLEGFISTNVLIDALKRCGRQVETEKLIDILENTRNLDLGLGVPLGFSQSEHQASHKIWGTELDETGKYQPIELD